jgi:hypothetical protein
MDIYIVLEDSGEKFKYLCRGILEKDSFRAVFQGSEDRLSVGFSLIQSYFNPTCL